MNITHLDKIEAIAQHSVEYDVPESKELILEVFDELRKRLVAEEAAKAAVMTFPCKGGEWALTASMVKEYEDTFIDMDIIYEANQARMWCVANSSKRKTKQGMSRFLNSWLSRSNNDGKYRRREVGDAHDPDRPVTVDDMMAAYPGMTREEAKAQLEAK